MFPVSACGAVVAGPLACLQQGQSLSKNWDLGTPVRLGKMTVSVVDGDTPCWRPVSLENRWPGVGQMASSPSLECHAVRPISGDGVQGPWVIAWAVLQVCPHGGYGLDAVPAPTAPLSSAGRCSSEPGRVSLGPAMGGGIGRALGRPPADALTGFRLSWPHLLPSGDPCLFHGL